MNTSGLSLKDVIELTRIVTLWPKPYVDVPPRRLTTGDRDLEEASDCPQARDDHLAFTVRNQR